MSVLDKGNKMQIYLICWFLLPLNLHFVQSAIIELSSANFETKLEQHEIALVIFHAHWCHNCKNLMANLPEIDRKLQKLSPPISIFTIDCESGEKIVCDKYQISGYPTITSFRKAKEYGKFKGNRAVGDIVNFMKIEAGPVARVVDNLKDLESSLRDENRVCLVANLIKQSKLEETFNSLAEKLRENVCFLYSHTDSEISWIKLFQDPKLWNKFEDNFVQYDGDDDISTLENFIKNKYHGLVGVRTYYNKDEFNFPLVIGYYDVDYTLNVKGTNYWRNRILKIATKYKNEFHFAISRKNEFEDDLRVLNMQELPENKPVIVVVYESNEKFALKENFSMQAFDQFLNDVLHKKLTPHLKSQNPVKQDDLYMSEAVGTTFYDFAINHTNDTMVELYSPWCGHCREFEPVYQELAEMLKDEEINFVKIDATENDVPIPYIAHDGFPTIFFSTKGKRMKPAIYEGDRTIHNLIKFIAEHASKELKLYDKEGNLKSTKTEL